MFKTNHWVATISANHAAKGRDLGILQVNHGKSGPLKRMRPGDGVVIYSPKDSYPSGATLQMFTAIGRVADGSVYQGEMGGGFIAFRRDVHWLAASSVAIRPLLSKLHLTRDMRNWGMVFRFGLVAISVDDFQSIARAMDIETSLI